jgi:tRNA modification GTPase
MFSPDDSIVAIATPPGRGGIGVVRISGPGAQSLAGTLLERRTPLEPRRATYTRVIGTHQGSSEACDEVVVTYFPAPHSYTGQDVVEISAHGSPVVLQSVVRRAIDAGARLARPGEFTLRAFLNGKRDLIQAEAIADLVDACTPLQARMAYDQLEGTLTRQIAKVDARLLDLTAQLEASLDFPDAGYHFIEPTATARAIRAVVGEVDDLLGDASRGRLIREGATVVVAGRANVGKSSLFNVLVGSERAIVTDLPGTTRDLVTERIDLQGLSITLVDTAGWRQAADPVEREGVARARQAWDVADLVLLVLDASEPLREEDAELLALTQARPRIVLANKIDLPDAPGPDVQVPECIRVSAVTREGLVEVRRAMTAALCGGEALRDGPAVSNVRHIALLERIQGHLAAAEQAATTGAPEEFVLTDLQAARAELEEIVGRRASDDVLNHIFARFCIGK